MNQGYQASVIESNVGKFLHPFQLETQLKFRKKKKEFGKKIERFRDFYEIKIPWKQGSKLDARVSRQSSKLTNHY